MKRLKSSIGGMTLVELSVILVVMGLVILLVMTLLPSFKRTAMTQQATRTVDDVHAALSGFAAARARLPWADSDSDGQENVGVTVGKLPYLTLGMAAPLRNSDGVDFRYAVFSHPDDSDLLNDAKLPEARNRWLPLIARNLPPAAQPRILGTPPPVNDLDFCRALFVAENLSSIDPAALQMVNGAMRKHVAWLLVDPGLGDADLAADGSPFDGLNASATTATPYFEHVVRGIAQNYDDQVHPMYFDALWERLGCSATVSAAGHAHANAESALAVLRQTMRDYQKQQEILEMIAIGEVVGASARVVRAAAEALHAASVSALVPSAAITNIPVGIASAGLAAAAVVANVAAVATAGVLVVPTGINLDRVQDRLDDIKTTLIPNLDTLYNDVQTNVVNADARGLYAP